MVHINSMMSKVERAPVDSSQSQVKSSGSDGPSSTRGVKAEQAPKEDNAAPTADEKKYQIDVGKVKEAAVKAEQAVAPSNSNIRYVVDIDERTERLIVKIIDKDTNEEIRQIPPDEMLNLAATREKTGLILDKKI